MFEWFTNWTIAKVITIVIAAVFLKPLLKAGFWFRQGILDHKFLQKVSADAAMARSKGLLLTPESLDAIGRSKRRRLIGFVGAPLLILVALTFYGVFMPWWAALGALGLIIMGFIDVN